MDERHIIIYGRHAVIEALRYRPETVVAVWLRDDVKDEVRASVDGPVPQLQVWSGKKVPVALPEGATHQGVIAKLDRQRFLVDYQSFMSDLSLTPDHSFVLLGELQDPHNVGAVIRNAAALVCPGYLYPNIVRRVSMGRSSRCQLAWLFTYRLLKWEM